MRSITRSPFSSGRMQGRLEVDPAVERLLERAGRELREQGLSEAWTRTRIENMIERGGSGSRSNTWWGWKEPNSLRVRRVHRATLHRHTVRARDPARPGHGLQQQPVAGPRLGMALRHRPHRLHRSRDRARLLAQGEHGVNRRGDPFARAEVPPRQLRRALRRTPSARLSGSRLSWAPSRHRRS